MKKRLVSMLLCIVMVLSCMPVMAFAADVEVIDAASALVTEPRDGEKPVFTAKLPDGADYSVIENGVIWYEAKDGAEWVKLSQTDSFQAGKQYAVCITLTPDEGFEFAPADEMMDAGSYINKFILNDKALSGKTEKGSVLAGLEPEQVRLQYRFKAVEAEYSITVNCGDMGVCYPHPEKSKAGEEIFLEVYANEGYLFTGWETVSGGVTVHNGKFVMPESDVVINALFKKESKPAPKPIPPCVPQKQYKVTVLDTFGGTAFANVSKAEKGDIVTLTAKAKPGFRFVKWVSYDKIVIKNGKFVMPGSNVTVMAVFEMKNAGKHTITFDPCGGIAAYDWDVTGTDGKLDKLPLAFKAGKFVLDGWYTAKVGGIKVTDKTVFYDDTTLYAHWKYSYQGGFPTYTLDFVSNSGTDFKSVSGLFGLKIDLSKYVPERNGFTFAGWYTDRGLTKEVSGVIKLVRNMTVYAKWTPVETVKPVLLPFTDIASNRWSYDAVSFVYSKGLMQGTDAKTFSPTKTTSRAMAAAVLHRLEGEPVSAGANIFSDVKSGSWCEKAVVWANSKGIVAGYKDGKFLPNDGITREQLLSILYRYAQYKGFDVSVDENTNFLSYNDVFDVHSYAMSAMMWALENDLIEHENGYIYPTEECSRELFASILYRFCKLYNID